VFLREAMSAGLPSPPSPHFTDKDPKYWAPWLPGTSKAAV